VSGLAQRGTLRPVAWWLDIGRRDHATNLGTRFGHRPCLSFLVFAKYCKVNFVTHICIFEDWS
jgi:hypothetical protein